MHLRLGTVYVVVSGKANILPLVGTEEICY